MKYLQVDAFTSLTARLQDCRMGQRVMQGRIEAFSMKRTSNDKKYAADLGVQYVHQQESFENEWKQLVAASSSRRFMANDDDKDITTQQEQQQQKRRGRSQSVSVCQDLSKQQQQSKRGVKHPRSSSFDEVIKLPHGSSRQFEASHQLTPLGDLRELSTRRLMTDLILTLNMSFRDYDFSAVEPRDFQLVSLQTVMQAVYSQLSPFLGSGSGSDMDVAAGIGSGNANLSSASREEKTSHTSCLITDLWNALEEHMQLKDCSIYSWSNGDMASEELWLWNFHYFFVNKALKRIVFFTCSESMQGHQPTEGDDDDDVEDDIVDETAPAAVALHQMADMEPEDADFDLDPSAAQAGGFSLVV